MTVDHYTKAYAECQRVRIAATLLSGCTDDRIHQHLQSLLTELDRLERTVETAKDQLEDVQ